jgi:hypothetical protein
MELGVPVARDGLEFFRNAGPDELLDAAQAWNLRLACTTRVQLLEADMDISTAPDATAVQGLPALAVGAVDGERLGVAEVV